MKQLQNINHDFDLQIGETGFTVRKGRKWYDKCDLGDILRLWKCKKAHSGKCTDKYCEFCGTGEIVHLSLEFFKNLTPELLMFEHSKKCKKLKCS